MDHRIGISFFVAFMLYHLLLKKFWFAQDFFAIVGLYLLLYKASFRLKP